MPAFTMPLPVTRRSLPPGDRRGRARAALVVLLPVALCIVLASLAVGAMPIPVSALLAAFAPAGADGRISGDSGSISVILFEIRMPRTILGFVVGGALATAGGMMQALFRNPLADPGIVGVSSGAALAAVAVIVAGPALLPVLSPDWAIFALPAAAFSGGLVTTLLLYVISTRAGLTSVATMLLAGIAVGALANAAIGIFIYLSNDQQLRELTFWMLGSLAGASWQKVAATAPFLVPVLVGAPMIGLGLNALQLGEAPAMHVGIDVQRLTRTTIVLVACAVGAAVAVSGIIGFVGIVVPHALRLVIGPDNRYLLPGCALLGGTMLLGADILARTIVAPAELPIGIVTALLGAPFFLWLLLQRRSAVHA